MRNDQVSSLLGATYEIPWPQAYGTLLSFVGVINIDIGWIRKPLNDLATAISGLSAGACNMNDMSAVELFFFHYSMLPLILMGIVAAYGLSLLFHKLNIMPKTFGANFKPEMALGTAISTLNFFMYAHARSGPRPPTARWCMSPSMPSLSLGC